jgi:hypothetical protein
MQKLLAGIIEPQEQERAVLLLFPLLLHAAVLQARGYRYMLTKASYAFRALNE